jgi:hypothetical protein
MTGAAKAAMGGQIRAAWNRPMKRSFKKEVDALRLGDGETVRGEGILVVTKALLQSGVNYVGAHQARQRQLSLYC